MASTYLTVAIPYVNAAPHLGYAYELVLADIVSRARRRLAGGEVRFVGGTDEHALKNVRAAEAAGVPTTDFVASHAARFLALRDPLQIGFDDFVQTSSDRRHRPAIEQLWNKVADRGDLYRGTYTGQYCLGCEQYYAPPELADGRCPEHGTKPESVSEENWFFRLSAYQGHLEELLTSGTLRVTPEAFRSEALAFVSAGLEDISVSRPATRARGWGIPVPGDPGQVVYVWFDALGSYVSALDYGVADSAAYRTWWCGADERVHVLGKGILRFHAVYWPAFLASAGELGPTRLHVHPYLKVKGAKISKSSGLSVDPVAIVSRYGADAVRWWFARDVHHVADTDFDVDRLVERADADLAGGLANAVNRVATLAHRHEALLVPPIDAQPISESADLVPQVAEALADFEFREGTQLLLDAVGALNRDLDASAPWLLANDSARSDELLDALARQVASARAIAQAAAPILPGLSARLAARLAQQRGAPLPEGAQLYPRLGARSRPKPG